MRGCEFMNLSAAFQGRHGLCRIILLFAGLLVLVTTVIEQFYSSSKSAHHVDEVSWFGLFGFIIIILYLFQFSWATILLRIGNRPDIDQTVLKQMDGGINGAAGGVIVLICLWWIALLVFTFWAKIGKLECGEGVSSSNPDCVVKTKLGFACAAWVFAIIQGICSVVLGFMLYNDIRKDKEGTGAGTGEAGGPKATTNAPSTTSTDANSFQNDPFPAA